MKPANAGSNWKPSDDGGEGGIPSEYVPIVGHWEPCKKHDYECMIHGDVCCESKKTFSSDDVVHLCGPAERMTVTSGTFSGWKFKCPEDKIEKGAKWLAVGSSLIGMTLYLN